MVPGLSLLLHGPKQIFKFCNQNFTQIFSANSLLTVVLVFFTRFDNMLAVTNGVGAEEHLRIQKSIGNRYPITVSMGIGAAETPYEAQRKAECSPAEVWGAQNENRRRYWPSMAWLILMKASYRLPL